MFGRWQSPTCTLCTWGQRCQRLCATDAGCYVRQCGRISALARGCCRLTLNLSEEGVRILQCTGSRPGCGDQERGGPKFQRKRPVFFNTFYFSYHNTYYLGCKSDEECQMRNPSKPKCGVIGSHLIGKCYECIETVDCWPEGGDKICSDNRCVTTEGLSYIMMIEKKVTLTSTIIKLSI